MAAATLCLVAGLAVAHEFKAGDLTIVHPWAPISRGGTKTGAVYLTIVNDGKNADRLLSASSPLAGSVEIHTHIHDADVMRMRRLDGVDAPPGSTIEFKPGGLHIMLLGLKQPLKDGDMFPMTLVFERAGSVPVAVMVADTGPE
jgi:hypothetical protein